MRISDIRGLYVFCFGDISAQRPVRVRNAVYGAASRRCCRLKATCKTDVPIIGKVESAKLNCINSVKWLIYCGCA